ncbi:MAG TPA: hypothetical protein VJL34_04490 [Anaerolineales bacterium]|nr:hypothetical protein [Anaerolineales bacterium]
MTPSNPRHSTAWFAPLHALIQTTLQAAGYQRDWDEALYIFEKRRL